MKKSLRGWEGSIFEGERMKKKTVWIFALVFTGVLLIALASRPDASDGQGWQPPVLVTTTPTSTLAAPDSWWSSLPTPPGDAILMPSDTPSPTPTP